MKHSNITALTTTAFYFNSLVIADINQVTSNGHQPYKGQQRLILVISMYMRIAVLCIITLLNVGCTKNSINEYAQYHHSFTQYHELSELILDRLAVSERMNFAEENAYKVRSIYKNTPEYRIDPLGMQQAELNNIVFSEADIRYYIDVIDPPVTHQLRTSIEIIYRYNEALAALINGDTAEVLANKVSELGAAAVKASTSTVSIVGLPASSPILPMVSELGHISSQLAAFEPLIELAFRQKSKKVFREELLSKYDVISAALDQLSHTIPSIFFVVKTSYLDMLDKKVRTPEETLRDLKAYRQLLANWSLLLNQSKEALALTKDVLSENAASGSTAAFITFSNDLDAVSRAVRANLAQIGQ
ncbi:hypothetical protein [Vibrio alfacsensis]|uniref:hypothetical protein n=1 Tax=Vibrio alfacsensis TaxID=1074311 RepID=UPI00406911BE